MPSGSQLPGVLRNQGFVRSMVLVFGTTGYQLLGYSGNWIRWARHQKHWTQKAKEGCPIPPKMNLFRAFKSPNRWGKGMKRCQSPPSNQSSDSFKLTKDVIRDNTVACVPLVICVRAVMAVRTVSADFPVSTVP